MKKQLIRIDTLKGLKKAEKLQGLGWICLHNGFFSDSVTMIKGTEEEVNNYRINRFN